MALEKFLKERITDAEVLVKELRKTFEYVSVLGSYTKTKQIISSTRMSAADDIDNECGFVIRLFDGTHYSEYSTDEIRGLDPQKVIASVRLPEMKQPFVKASLLEEIEKIPRELMFQKLGNDYLEILIDRSEEEKKKKIGALEHCKRTFHIYRLIIYRLQKKEHFYILILSRSIMIQDVRD